MDLRGIDSTKKLKLGCLISKEFKESLGLGSKLVEKQGFFYTVFSVLNPLSLVPRISFYLLVQGRPFHRGDLLPAFRETEEGWSVPFAVAVSYVTFNSN